MYAWVGSGRERGGGCRATEPTMVWGGSMLRRHPCGLVGCAVAKNFKLASGHGSPKEERRKEKRERPGPGETVDAGRSQSGQLLLIQQGWRGTDSRGQQEPGSVGEKRKKKREKEEKGKGAEVRSKVQNKHARERCLQTEQCVGCDRHARK